MYRTTGGDAYVPLFLGYLADAYGRSNRFENGLNVLGEALDVVDKTEQHFWEAELHRLRGELLLRSGRDASEAESSFHRGLAVARQQEARSVELRIAMNLARLGRDRGRPEEARRLLEGAYNWFAEGFDTADLREARHLLETLP